MPQMMSEKYWLEAVAIEKEEERLAKKRQDLFSLAQFAIACGLMGIVVSWQLWLPQVAKMTNATVQYFQSAFIG